MSSSCKSHCSLNGSSTDRALSTNCVGGGGGVGEIHVILGPMFAGKTTELLRRIKSEKAIGRTVAMVKSSKDDRYAIDSVVSHDGIKFPCWALSDLTSFKQNLGDEDYDKLDVIGIDEAQFFEDLYEFCRNAADNDGKTVILAGLDGDYLRRTFGSVLDIIPLADTVTKLTARCEFCGKRAFFTLRKSGDTRTELIGGAESYMPVCRFHYVKGQTAIVLECGYYIMRYMLEIVTRPNSTTTINEIFQDKMAYSEEEINQVQGLWANYFLNV